MATEQRTRPAWVEALLAQAHRPISEEEKARRREETRRLLAFRDSLPSIAPDTTAQYIREIRDEEDARA
jgi:hypothetical protein